VRIPHAGLTQHLLFHKSSERHLPLHAISQTLCRTLAGNLPSEQDEVAPAKIAPIGLKEPVKRPFDGVLDTDTPELNRSAMRAACRERCHFSSAFGSPSAERPAEFRIGRLA
jgi:hypothetical protein